MAKKSVRRCGQCRAPLPRDAGLNRRYCGSACRSRHWRRVRRHNEIYQRAVYQGLGLIKRTDSVYCSPAVAESLLDRLINTSHQVIMNGPNKRPKSPTDKNGRTPTK
ncbi:hypothetical protein ABZ464_39785 [Streptomyces sp. NPDC005820]|uniref:hypothetical protein n=1 Tax=Streptomyces sp. NPDC005820 TaxID=3157069 RepID=UPI0033E8E229